MRSRFARKTDRSQSSIVESLRKAGVQCIVTNYGNDFPDILCGSGNFWMLLELKEPTGYIDRGQMKFISEARGPVNVATTFEMARRIVMERIGISPLTQMRITQWLLKNDQETLSINKFFELIRQVEL